MLSATGNSQVIQGHFVDWEDRNGGSEFWRHVSDGCSVSQRHLRHSGAIELNELANNAVLTQHLGDGKDNVGCSRSGRNLAG